jgi:signal transduction histidine kinase
MSSTRLPAKEERDRHRRFQTTFQSASIGIGICSVAGLILEVNPEFSRMLGFGSDELVNANIFELDPIHCRLVFRGKASFANEHDEASVDGGSQDKRLLRELLRGERPAIVREKRCLRKNDSELWGQLTVSLARNLRGEPAFLIALLSDASEQRQVQEHLQQAEQMEVIGRLAGGIAHDFNNLLTGMLLYCDLLSAGLEGNKSVAGSGSNAWQPLTEPGRDSMPESSELSKHVEEMRMAGEQGAALTQQLLAIARKRTAEPIPVSINEVVISTKNLLQRLIGERIELLTNLDANSGTVLADPGQLRQILLNLVLNARDAMPQGGTITLSTKPAEIALKNRAPGTGDCSLQPAVALLVKDNGCGMDAATQSQIFEPLFTTKKLGTGLGLMTVHRIVTEAGGAITVVSEPGCGTGIEIFFPSLATRAETFAEEKHLSTFERLQAAISPEPFAPAAISRQTPFTRKHLTVAPLCSPSELRGGNRKIVTQHLKPRGDHHV